MQRPSFKRIQKHPLTQNHPHTLLIAKRISTNISTDNNLVSKASDSHKYEKWSTLLSVLAQGGTDIEPSFFEATQMLNSGAKPSGYALVHLGRAATDLGLDCYCQQLHCYIVKSGFVPNVFVSAALVRFYRKIESLNDAYKMFVEIPRPNVVSWNTLISGFVQSGHFSKALGLFLQLERSEVCANAYSFTAALAACGKLSLMQVGRSIHAKIVKYGLECGNVVENCLIDMYGKCGCVEDAIQVFDNMIDRDIISWNSVVAAGARNGELELAFNFFCQISNPDTISYNELVSGIAQFGNLDDAIRILSEMPNPNSSSWTSILTGYVNRNRAQEALKFFGRMHSLDVEMDEFTFSIILSGVAGLSALTWGMLIHCCTVKRGLDTLLVVGSALIDMYSKCGLVKNAESMFRLLPQKNVVTWNAMISGYAHNGNSTKVVQLFEWLKMESHLKPDDVTFLNVLAACSNDDMPLQKAMCFFESMVKDYGIEPTAEHCCTMIRLMGHRGNVWSAWRMIHELGFGSSGVVWRTLLGACGTCRDLKVAEIAAAKVIELEGDGDYVFVILSNIFASYGKWRDVNVVRKLMRKNGVRKEAGYSWIELENVGLHSLF